MAKDFVKLPANRERSNSQKRTEDKRAGRKQFDAVRWSPGGSEFPEIGPSAELSALQPLQGLNKQLDCTHLARTLPQKQPSELQ